MHPKAHSRQRESFSWTDEAVDTLRDMWPDYSATQIAQFLGAPSRNAVIGKAHRLGLSGQKTAAKIKANAARTAQLRTRPRHADEAQKPRAPKLAVAAEHKPTTAPPAIAPEPQVVAITAPVGGIPIMEAADDQCMAIMNDPLGPDVRVCGASVHARGSSWCRMHADQHRGRPAKPRDHYAKAYR